MSCFCNETAEMATNHLFCSCPSQSRNKCDQITCLQTVNEKKRKKNPKNNPMKKKSIPKGEERCSNCQVELYKRKKPKGAVTSDNRHICCRVAGWLEARATSGIRCLDASPSNEAGDTVTTRLWTNVDRNKRGKIHSD